MHIVYLSGKYSDSTREAIDENIQKARRVAIQLWEAGFAVICPHLNTAHFGDDCKCNHEDYIKGDLAPLRRSDIVVMLDNWFDSVGAKMERKEAMRYNKPLFYEPEEAVKWKERNSKSALSADSKNVLL
jgi:hypothetical protein